MRSFCTEVVRFEKFVPGGQAIGNLADGRKVFAWGVLQNETARVEIYKNKKSYAEAVATEIIEKSADRISPRDDCYLATSPWQILDFAAENYAKEKLVRESFAQEKITLPENLTIKTDSREYFYRNKMEYALWWDNDSRKISLAFHRRGSHQKIAITQSSIEMPEIFAAASRIVDELNSRNEEARKYQSLVMRANQNGETSGALFENFAARPKMRNLTDEIFGREFSYSPNGFFQINLPVYEMALREIANNLGGSRKVVDMYAGVGTIGLSVAKNHELILVETDKNAFAEMQNNIPPNSENIRGICAKSEESLEFISRDATIILDPPRAGLDEKVIAKILEVRPPKVIYLSCNPTTQARDAQKLLAKYKIAKIQPFNFFPRTPHIENLVVLDLI